MFPEFLLEVSISRRTARSTTSSDMYSNYLASAEEADSEATVFLIIKFRVVSQGLDNCKKKNISVALNPTLSRVQPLLDNAGPQTFSNVHRSTSQRWEKLRLHFQR